MGNEGKSATSFCQQVAAWVPDMFCNFYFVKNHKIAKKSTTTNAKEKISTDLKSLENFDLYSTNLRIKQILLNEIRPQSYTIRGNFLYICY